MDKITRVQEILEQKEVADMMAAADTGKDISQEELLKIFADNGVELTTAELGEIVKQLAGKNDELDEDALEDVAGGRRMIIPCPMPGLLLWKFGHRHGWW